MFPPTRQDISVMEEHKAWLQELLTTGQYSDIELKVKNEKYTAHRLIVCYWSPVIRQSCVFNAVKFAHGQSKPNEPGNATMKASFDFGDADPQAVDCMVQFFYKRDYQAIPSICSDKEGEDESSATGTTIPECSLLVLHSKVFTLAHIYDVAGLRKIVVDKFHKLAQLEWRSKCLVEAAREAYNATPPNIPEMREAIVKVLAEHRKLWDEDYIKELLVELSQLTLDILTYMNKTRPHNFWG
ncbi:unnamed protein product [Clonostachys rosea f. rosea IK726]|nr:unnamed protein product [Clonostachys rosea f. rosea IK726]CAG9953922.1 unnamed protein product [Clonostachys rosea f. rosea IK726]